MEIFGHELFPELRSQRRKVGERYRDFQRHLTRLEHDDTRAKAAEEAARLAKQQAKDEEGEFYLSDVEEYFTDANLRAKIHGSQATGLLDLPPEVLIIIVGYTADRLEVLSRPNMRSLRLVHPQLANLRYLKTKLFGTFFLTPDPAQLWRIQKTADSIAPCVSEVIFRPVVIDKSKVPRGRMRDTNAVIKKAMKPRIDEVMASGKVQSIWVDFLKKLNSNAAISIRYDMKEDSVRFTCPGPPPQPFLQLVVRSLMASGLNASELELRHCTQSASIWSNVDGWGDIDLSALKFLKFSFTIRDIMRHRVDSDKHLRTFAHESARVLRCLLKGSSSTLQSLTIDTDASTLLSSDSFPVLPALRSLKLAHPVTIGPTQLGVWLAGMPELQSFVLHNVRLDGDQTLHGWRPIFDFIRSHQSFNLKVDFQGRITPSIYISFSHRTSELVEEGEDHTNDVRASIIKMLRRYVSRLGKWEENT